jgi:hypothetical protein
VGEDAEADAKLSVAIEYSSDVSDDMLRSWQRENSTGFAELEIRPLASPSHCIPTRITTFGQPSAMGRAHAVQGCSRDPGGFFRSESTIN